MQHLASLIRTSSTPSTCTPLALRRGILGVVPVEIDSISGASCVSSAPTAEISFSTTELEEINPSPTAA